mgnify:CR=1 FL=1
MENINIYTKIKFPEFYELIKHLLNEDVWIIIYKMSLPKFIESDKCYLYSKFSNNIENVEICNIYYHKNYNKYLYSYYLFGFAAPWDQSSNISFCKYAEEENLELSNTYN